MAMPCSSCKRHEIRAIRNFSFSASKIKTHANFVAQNHQTGIQFFVVFHLCFDVINSSACKKKVSQRPFCFLKLNSSTKLRSYL